MSTKKLSALSVGSMLFIGCLGGCGFVAASQSMTPLTEMNPQQVTSESSPCLAAFTEDNAEHTEVAGGGYPYVNFEEQFKPYAQFGLTYDAGKNELQYKGKVVRWFEDYYPLSEDGAQAGMDFFNENGVVDVYAVRDLSNLIRNTDGSFDPSGKLIGVKEFPEKEFTARDIEAIKNPQPVTLISGDRMLTAEELEEIAKEYETFGVTYDAQNDQWYFNGEKVRFFRDVLTSNGESLTSGNFKGTMRTFNSNGTIDIYTVRDFLNLDTSGNGTLTGIEKFSQEEFDARTQSNIQVQISSGECTVTQE
ncbi:MAG: hypothetical protein NC433_16140 [Clostridiales bacterium]|nr:hypothetical protein [Clostridiales bacterium]